MTPRVCADALYTDWLSHLKGCKDCQERGQRTEAGPLMAASCPEGWRLLKAWGDAGKRERAESAAMELDDCAEGL